MGNKSAQFTVYRLRHSCPNFTMADARNDEGMMISDAITFKIRAQRYTLP